MIAQLNELQDESLKGVILPVSFGQAYEVLEQHIKSFRPDRVIALGLAGNREHIEFERIAINMDDSTSPDNEGVTKTHENIIDKGPDGLFTTLPIDQWYKDAQQRKYPIRISNSAGTYVCNHVMYKLLYNARGTSRQGGFIHLPPNLDLHYMTDIIRFYSTQS